MHYPGTSGFSVTFCYRAQGCPSTGLIQAFCCRSHPTSIPSDPKLLDTVVTYAVRCLVYWVGQPSPSGSIRISHTPGGVLTMACLALLAKSSLRLAVLSDFTKDLRKGDAQISVCPSALTHPESLFPEERRAIMHVKLGSGPFLKTPLSYCSLYWMVNCTPWCSWRWLGQDGAT